MAEKRGTELTLRAEDDEERRNGVTLLGSAKSERLQGTSRDDLLDGGAGSDQIDAGSGNDVLVYRMAENAGAKDRYDGGSGTYTLRLEFTRAEWLRADVQADVARFLGQLQRVTIRGEESEGNSDWFGFKAFGLDVRKVEKLEVRVDGVALDPRDEAVLAVNDLVTVNEDGSV